jgi:hypothetical protein
MGIYAWLFKKHKNIITENGMNKTFYQKRRKILKEKFYSKDGKRHGKYESFYSFLRAMGTDGKLINGATVCITANYKEGKLHGECKTWTVLTPFGGGCYRYIENYENGELLNRKVYYTGASKPIVDPIKKIKELANEESFEPGSSEIGYIKKKIDHFSDI